MACLGARQTLRGVGLGAAAAVDVLLPAASSMQITKMATVMTRIASPTI